MAFRGVQITENEIGEVVEFATAQELDAYAKGFGDGISKYGAGGAWVCTCIEELDDLDDNLRDKVENILLQVTQGSE